jgi:DNA end-binding protein Ku
MVPSGKTGLDAYAVIREAMEKCKKIALGRLVTHQRERIVAMEPVGALRAALSRPWPFSCFLK